MEKEVEKYVKEMSKTSAPRPDGIALGHLVKVDPKYSLLMEIFILWLKSGTIPNALRD